MSFDMPNYYNSEDRRMYNELVEASSKRKLQREEEIFVGYMKIMSAMDSRKEVSQ